MRVEGRCLCGDIVYEAEVKPGTASICHCADCQRQSGSVFRMNIPAPADTFHLLRGMPKTYLKISDRGNKRIHAFCGTCGGPVYSSAAENVQSYSLRVGALEQRYELQKPARQIWTKRMFPWLPHIEGTQEFSGQS
ncbi:hypothetical protein OKW40_001826 [Paraburkholderia sp. RAU6.4a]